MAKKSDGGTSGFEPPKYLSSLIAAVNEGAKAAQAGSFLFLLVGLYLLATAFSASDEDLLLGRTVTISQIGASLPVSFSFAIAPLVFVFLHGYALVRYDMLAANVRQFNWELRETVPLKVDRERCQQLLANVEFINSLTVPRGSSLYSAVWPWLFRGIAAGFPVLVLLLVQINALRYQSDMILWVQRLWLVADLLVLMWFFHRNVLDGSAGGWRVLARRPRWGLVWMPVAVLALNFLYLGVVPSDAAPDLIRYDLSKKHFWTEVVRDAALRPLDTIFCPELNWGCRFLRVEHRTLVDKVWDDKVMASLRDGSEGRAKALAAVEGVVLRGRSLRFAVLDESRMYAVDLSGADLRHASLFAVIAPGARVNSAQLQGVDLVTAQLQGAHLVGAQLQGANMVSARMQGSELRFAQMQGATLEDARLQDADMSATKMQGADLRAVQAQGADLSGAWMQGADLSGALMQGASLAQAELQGAYLVGAQMQGAELAGVRMQGADLGDAQMQGAYLVGAEMQGADLDGAQMQAADLRFAHLWRVQATMHVRPDHLLGPALLVPVLSRTDLALADLRGTEAISAPSKEDLSELAQGLGGIANGDVRRRAEQRLQRVLAPVGDVPKLEFAATPERPVLAPDSIVPPLVGDEKSRVTSPGSAYVSVLAEYLDGMLAGSEPAVASGIAQRVVAGLRANLDYAKPDVEERRVAAVVVCRLLDGNKLEQEAIEWWKRALRDSGQVCQDATAGSETAP